MNQLVEDMLNPQGQIPEIELYAGYQVKFAAAISSDDIKENSATIKELQMEQKYTIQTTLIIKDTLEKRSEQKQRKRIVRRALQQ